MRLLPGAGFFSSSILSSVSLTGPLRRSSIADFPILNKMKPYLCSLRQNKLNKQSLGSIKNYYSGHQITFKE